MSKNIYFGKSTLVTNYEWITINSSNISSYFTITDGTYYFSRSGATMTSNNNGVHNSTASTSLKPIKEIAGFSFNWSVSSETNYDKFYVTYGTASDPQNIVEEVSGVKNGTCSKEIQISTNIYLIFYYIKDSSTNSNNDKAIISNFKIKVKLNQETKPIARQVTKLYVGINNIARKVKRGYIGVNGIARMFYTVPPLERGNSIKVSTSNTNSYGFIAAENSSYAIFNDGVQGSSLYYLVNSSGTVTTATQTTFAFIGMTGAGNSNYAYFMGGKNSGGTIQKYGVRVNTSGTRATTSFGSGIVREYLYSFGSGCNSGNLNNSFAIFAGGNNGDTNIKYIDYADTSGTWKYTTLSVTTYDAAVADNGTYAYIAGGATNEANGYSGQSTVVNTLNSSGTRSTTTGLSIGLISACGARAGKLAIIGGGASASMNPSNVVNAYNTSNTRLILSTMPYGRAYTSAASAGNYTLFIGNLDEKDHNTWYGDAYNSSGTLEINANTKAFGYCLGRSTTANKIGSHVYYIDNYDFLEQNDFYIRSVKIND